MNLKRFSQKKKKDIGVGGEKILFFSYICTFFSSLSFYWEKKNGRKVIKDPPLQSSLIHSKQILMMALLLNRIGLVVSREHIFVS